MNMQTRQSSHIAVRHGAGKKILFPLLVMLCGVVPPAELVAAETVSETVVSRFGGYRAAISIDAQAERYPELNRWRAIVRDAVGNELYRLDRPIPYDTPYPALALSDQDGAAVLLNAFDGIVEFIDARGATVRRWRPFASETPSHERILKCSIAGSRVAFLASDPLEKRAVVYAMTIDGLPHATAELAEQQAGELYLSDDGTVIVAGGSTPLGQITVSTALMDWDGRLMATVPFDVRLADIRIGTAQVALADTRAVLLVDLDTGGYETLWSEDRPGAIVTGLRLLEPGVAVCSQSFAYPDGIPSYTNTRVVLLSPDGVTLFDRSVEGESSAPVALDAGAGEIRVSVGQTTTSLPVPR